MADSELRHPQCAPQFHETVLQPPSASMSTEISSPPWAAAWTYGTPPPAYGFADHSSHCYPSPLGLVSPLTTSPWVGRSSTPPPAHASPLSPSQGRKRKADENQPPAAFKELARSLPSPPKKKKRRGRNADEKLSLVLDAIYEEAGWKLGEFLWHVFRYGDDVHRTPEHVGRVERFLKGNSSYTPAMILKLWLNHPDGRVQNGGELFAMSPEYSTIKPVRQALTAFAAQTIRQRVVKEAEAAVAPNNGLHASKRATRSRRDSDSEPAKKERVVWSDIGGATITHVSNVIRKHQPVTWKLAQSIAIRSDDPQRATVVRVRRPPELVIMQAISSLNFSRTNRANLFPTARALMYFALSAPYDLFLHNSRLGSMIGYSTTLRTLQGLAEHEAELVRTHGKDPTTVGVIWLDNVQNYLLQRDQRIGRENVLNIGVAATYVELPSSSCSAMDLEDKRRRLAENRRKGLTVEQLLEMIDVKHRETVGTLQWLRVLTNYVPELSKYKTEVSSRYRSQGAKQPLETTRSRVHPLGTSGKNESITTELKDALLDFLEQVGQTPQDHNKQLLLLGGDGLTFEKIVQLKNYLQFHTDNIIDSLELVQPVLALWHTLWADLSRIFETHWGGLLTRDPSTLGHSATKIGRRAPSNLKKVDFHFGTELAYLVLDARMLDCWRLYFKQNDLFSYFASLARDNRLPSFSELEIGAKKLFRAYSSHRAAERALYSADTSSLRPPGEWEETVPLGSPWNAFEEPSAEPGPLLVSSAHTASDTTSGDHVLADSIAFIKDTWVSREFMYAVAEGDIGRVYEAMKMFLFTFAGSSHTKYTGYLLEFICSLELESSEQLRRSILDSLLINLTGQPGRFSPGDLIQEYFNRLLQAIAERKGVEYNNHFIRDVLSRNLHHLACLQDDLKESLGLKERPGRHAAPHLKPELAVLLREYREQELHSRRPGRQCTLTQGSSTNRKASETAPRDRDDYRRGVRSLRSGKLAKWIKETVFLRSATRHAGTTAVPELNPSDSDSEMDLDDTASEDPHDSESPASLSDSRLPFVRVVDGELVFESVDTSLDAQAIASAMEETAHEGDNVLDEVELPVDAGIPEVEDEDI